MGATGTEVELKLRVDDLSALMRIGIASGGTPAPTAYQDNNYLDTPARDLLRIGVTLRLRCERTSDAAHYTLTAKSPVASTAAATDGLTVVQEEEVDVDADVAAELLAGQGDALACLAGGSASRAALVARLRALLAGQRLIVIGRLRNERIRVPVQLRAPSGVTFACVLELDRSMFPGDQTHHEVELEVPDGVSTADAAAALHALFARAGVKGRTSRGKASRFFAALGGETLT